MHASAFWLSRGSPHHAQWEGSVVGAAPQESKYQGCIHVDTGFLMGVKPAMEGEKTMRVKPALGGEKHVHVNVGESRSQLKIPQKTVDLAVQMSHSSLWNDI